MTFFNCEENPFIFHHHPPPSRPPRPPKRPGPGLPVPHKGFCRQAKGSRQKLSVKKLIDKKVHFR
jgi:hypothetical protein